MCLSTKIHLGDQNLARQTVLEMETWLTYTETGTNARYGSDNIFKISNNVIVLLIKQTKNKKISLNQHN